MGSIAEAPDDVKRALFDMNRPLSPCRHEFMTRKECVLEQENINLKIDGLKSDFKEFRNQLAAIFTGSLALFTCLWGVIQYFLL